MPTLICKQKVGNITYKLHHFEGDNKYVICKCDEEKWKNGQVHLDPTIGVFNSEKEAREYLKSLKKN